MTTAQIVFELYKTLPKKGKKELKSLIDKEQGEIVEINLREFKQAVNQVKQFREGKIQARPISELFKELENEM